MLVLIFFLAILYKNGQRHIQERVETKSVAFAHAVCYDIYNQNTREMPLWRYQNKPKDLLTTQMNIIL